MLICWTFFKNLSPFLWCEMYLLFYGCKVVNCTVGVGVFWRIPVLAVASPLPVGRLLAHEKVRRGAGTSARRLLQTLRSQMEHRIERHVRQNVLARAIQRRFKCTRSVTFAAIATLSTSTKVPTWELRVRTCCSTTWIVRCWRKKTETVNVGSSWLDDVETIRRLMMC